MALNHVFRQIFSFLFSARGSLLLDSEHTDALQKIKYLESRPRRAEDEEAVVAEPPTFGHPLRSLKLEEGQSAHFETTLAPVNDASMKVGQGRYHPYHTILTSPRFQN